MNRELFLNEKMHGFTVCRIQALDELNGVLYELSHDKTGLKMMWISREEENKTFAIAFPTIPFDDTGVFHILEHSVLCGSDRYPVKEPFVALLKTSMNTFLNALTFPDKTMYPVCSRNSKDFLNLMRVYLDAVFHTRITSTPEIFRQEGWHYEFAEDGSMSYKGVVFNEMKGAFADVDRQAAMEADRALFPDCPYRFVSGGDPAKIPDLTYEKYIETYQRFYSPTNGYVFLDGSLDIEAVLALMNEEYLADMEAGERVEALPFQKPVDAGTHEIEYEIPQEEVSLPRERLLLGRVTGTYDEQIKLTALRVLTDVLCGSNQAPLAKPILEQGLAEDVSLSLEDSSLQSTLALEVVNYKKEDLPEIERILAEVLQEQISGGLDHEQIAASLINLEFQMRERDFGSYPQGLMFGMASLTGWMYGYAPEDDLLIGDRFALLRRKLEEGYFEQLIRECLIENPHRCRILMHPSVTCGEEIIQAEKERLAQIRASWNEEQLEEAKKRQEELLEWQNAEETPEQLASIPQLALEDIDPTPEKYPSEVEVHNGLTTLLHRGSSNGILYLRLYFDMGDLTGEELSLLSFASCLMGELPTAHHSFMELENAKRRLCGYQSFQVVPYSADHDADTCGIKFCLGLSAMADNLDQALEMSLEILNDTVYEDETDIRDILRQQKTDAFQAITMSGHSVAAGRLAAMLTSEGAADEYISGVAWYQWLKKQDENWQFTDLMTRLQNLLKERLNRKNLVFSVTGEPTEAVLDALSSRLSVYASDNIPADGLTEECHLTPWGIRNEGIVVPAEIAFAVRGGDIRKAGLKSEGGLPLAKKIISLDYLWNAVRVQGGAYGVGLMTRDNGMTACYSYRDPDASRSLKKYLECGSFLKEFAQDDPDLTGYIIGTVSDLSPLRTIRAKGNVEDSRYFKQITWEERCRRRAKLLTTTNEDLAKMADAVSSVIEQGGICVVGGQEQVKACQPDVVITL